MPVDPVLDAIVCAAVDITAADRGWIVALDGDRLRVVASAGGDRPGEVIDAEFSAGSGTAGLVIATGQPMAVSARDDDPTFDEGIAARFGARPSAVLCVPCEGEGIVGALELVDKAGGERFTFDDVEVVTLLARIAAAAMGSRDTFSVPPPQELARAISEMAAVDPGRYVVVATAVAALVDHG